MPAPIIVRRNVLHRGVAAAAAPAAMSFITASTPKQYLTTTWGHTPTDPTRVTISYWINYTITPTSDQYMFTTSASSSTLFDLTYQPASFKVSVADDVSASYNVKPFGIAPDSGVWHHILLQVDTNQATAADRIKVYGEGVLGTDPPTISPTLAQNMQILPNGIVSYIGDVSYQIPSSTGIPDAKFAYFYVIDGQALTPSSFTTGTGAGTIRPITYAGTFGANGFFLNGSGSTTNDQSGNHNDWTAPNGITFSTDLPPP